LNQKKTKKRWFWLRGPWLYEHLTEPAQGVKVLLQMIVGVAGSVIVIAAVLEDIHGGRTATYMEKHALVIIAASLAVAASLELAYSLFTPGPDEAIDPLMLGISAVFLYLVSGLENLTWTAGISVVLFASTLAVLFWVRQRFIDDSDVRKDQPARRAALEHKVDEAMGKPQTSAALDLLEIAEFAWHDRFDDLGLPEKTVQEILEGSHQQLGDMIALIRAKLEDH
jgi:hypothetical protein